mmetsp:Transcript_21336/g.36326  ORF Transcript_21336/g.36326 Transcript_21336/m.36326 type:complete len:231 (-) Transcript_21336:86-778(-)
MEIRHLCVKLSICVEEDACELFALCNELWHHILPPAKAQVHPPLLAPPSAHSPGIHIWVGFDDGVRGHAMALDGLIYEAQTETNVEDVCFRTSRTDDACMPHHQGPLPPHHHRFTISIQELGTILCVCQLLREVVRVCTWGRAGTRPCPHPFCCSQHPLCMHTPVHEHGKDLWVPRSVLPCTESLVILQVPRASCIEQQSYSLFVPPICRLHQRRHARQGALELNISPFI